MTDLQFDIINGTMLGDACIKKEGRYRFKQCIAHEGYVEHIRQALKPWATHLAKCFEKKPNNIDGKVINLEHWNGEYLEACYFYTVTNQIFKDLRSKWYKDSKKIVPKDLILNPRMMAYWFMDDGSNSPKKRQVYFATEGFLQKDSGYLILQLSRLGIKATQQKDGKGGYKTAVSCKHYFDFIDMISPYVVDTMKRKVDVVGATKQREGWFPGKLNRLKAREIRRRYMIEEITQKELAAEYGVSLTTIQKVINDRIYPEANMGLRGSAEVKLIL
jgi:hypothetical protein